ncbi:hypothetical protein ACO22_03979 [Paracoccidioides brasiliensis]|uniref:Uncharacterized protein n=1 Tax=Paracoccidioides brasiliensis TaxID=121759 RepID=A0A1D2JEE8_PARBR|nr:hypothetical protein ACO22_03979 [Paracoccidioides brasiliensis]
MEKEEHQILRESLRTQFTRSNILTNVVLCYPRSRPSRNSSSRSIFHSIRKSQTLEALASLCCFDAKRKGKTEPVSLSYDCGKYLNNFDTNLSKHRCWRDGDREGNCRTKEGRGGIVMKGYKQARKITGIEWEDESSFLKSEYLGYSNGT